MKNIDIETAMNYFHFEIAAIYFLNLENAVKLCFKNLYKIYPLKNTWGSFGHVEIYDKIDYFWTFEHAVFFYKMTI
jgi:hypothetical protein